MLLLLVSAAGARADTKGDPWAAFRFLIGDWVGEGDGTPAKGSGGFSLKPELDGKILVRKNRAEYPAAGTKPATVHEDLMVIQIDKKDGPQATYWDNEGHVIQYGITPSADGNSLVFLSTAVAGQPRFRLTYAKAEKQSVTIKFEIATPDKPDDFKTYINAKANRKGKVEVLGTKRIG
jgi:hypothetical protein